MPLIPAALLIALQAAADALWRRKRPPEPGSPGPDIEVRTT
jgi:hypothetical protein